MSGILYIVSTPIGDPGDITMRALRVISEADAIICEERRIGSSLLQYYKIAKSLVELNEHTEEQEVPSLLERLANGQNLALISDHGTPLLVDPGAKLVERALGSGFRVVPVPGASSVIAALVSSGLPAHRFRFVGLLPRKSDLRRRALNQIKGLPETFVLMDAPYRLVPLLKSLEEELGGWRQIAIACNLTMPDEQLVHGTVKSVLKTFERQPFKGEFVAVVEGFQEKKSVVIGAHPASRSERLKGELT